MGGEGKIRRKVGCVCAEILCFSMSLFYLFLPLWEETDNREGEKRKFVVQNRRMKWE